jgi:hypothetical protein
VPWTNPAEVALNEIRTAPILRFSPLVGSMFSSSITILDLNCRSHRSIFEELRRDALACADTARYSPRHGRIEDHVSLGLQRLSCVRALQGCCAVDAGDCGCASSMCASASRWQQ